MGWKLVVEGIDLRNRIPAESDLGSHDYPLESWAGQALGDILGQAVTRLGSLTMEALIERGRAETPQDREAADLTLASYQRDWDLAIYLRENVRVTRPK